MSHEWNLTATDARRLGLLEAHEASGIDLDAKSREHLARVRVSRADGMLRRLACAEALADWLPDSCLAFRTVKDIDLVASVTVMRAAGVPDRIVAAWHGHDETIMRRTYDHEGSDRDAMASAAEVLAMLRRSTA